MITAIRASERARPIDDDAVTLYADQDARAIERGHCEGVAPFPRVAFTRTHDGALVVERSGFGGRPAYVRSGTSALASTDLDELVRVSRVRGLPITLDPDALARACAFDPGAVGDTRSLVRELQEVPPATRAIADARGWTFEPLPTPRAIDRDASPAGLRARLESAVALACEGSATVAVLCGGGLDSSALLALTIANLGTTKANAFALDFPGEGDDRPYLAALAQSLGISPFRLSPSATELARSFTAAGLPLTWPSGAAEATLLTEARRWGADRAIAGLGGDEAFDGDREAAARLLVRDPRAALRLASVRSLVRPWVRAAIPPRLRRLLRRRTRPSTPPWAGPRWRRVASEARERGLSAKPRFEMSAFERVDAAFRSPHFARAAALRLQEERLGGIPRIDVYLDEDLATFAAGLPPEAHVEGGTRRALFRNSLRGVLLDEVRTRRDKASFEALHRAFFAPPLFPQLAPFRTPERLADLGIVEPRVFSRAVDEAVALAATPPGHHAALHATIAVEAFLRGWDEGR